MVLKINKLVKEFEPNLEEFILKKDLLSKDLKDAMLYSLNRGGKRLRPGLSLLTTETFGYKANYIYSYAAALEMIHEFSLIHDDLPCMDNDDYRRGKPATHKVFGETNALLAGDALLNLSSEIAFKDMLENYNENKIKAYSLMFKNAGSEGMIDGQSFELVAKKNLDDYMSTILKKTYALFEISIYGTGIYLGLSEEILAILKDLSYNIGIGFQVIDDKCDKDGIYLISTSEGDKIIKDCKKNIDSIYEELNNKNFDVNGYKELTDRIFSKDFINY